MSEHTNNACCAEKRKTSIGGQALIEGIMMKGPNTSAMAVRKPDGEIHVETWETFKNGKKPWYAAIPLVRGLFNFFDSLAGGYKCLMRSAEIAGMEEEPSDFEKKMIGIFGKGFSNFLMYAAMLLGMLLAVGLFVLLPTVLVNLVADLLPQPWLRTALEGVVKIILFVLYMAAVSRSSDMRRTFEYHGAEHKTIACYEAGEALTPENVKKYTRFHPRCGTSFLLIILVVSILVNSFITWESAAVRVVLKLVLMPLTVGIAYEIIRLAGRHRNALTRAISAPGLWLQKLTTAEPDLEQIAVAIAAMQPCIPGDGSDNW